MSALTILDGPIGTQLDARGVGIGGHDWSAAAICSHADVIRQIHRDYLQAGATVHTANTFRTKRRTVGDQWESLTRTAVRLTRESVGSEMRVAGSIAPLADCYRPDLSPADSHREITAGEHSEMAQMLADAGCNVLLCETFAHLGESHLAVEQAVRTGIETWIALTAGPDGDLLTPTQLAAGSRRAVDLGAAAVLVNCVAATKTLPYIRALADANLGVPFGAYANAGRPGDQLGWNDESDASVSEYARLARTWVDAGATIIGGCCGTTPRHIRALK